MTVKDVMELLSTLDPNSEVCIGYVDADYNENEFAKAVSVYPVGTFVDHPFAKDKVVISEELVDDQGWIFG